MSRVATPLTLPAKIRAWLDAKLIDSSFSNYRLLAEELKEQGHYVSKSALHRYGKALQARQAQQDADRLASDEQMVNALCILAAAISSPDNVVETAKTFMDLARNGGAADP